MVSAAALASYLLAAIETWAPPGIHDWKAPREDTLARYRSIAHDAALVALDPREPSLFAGELGRVQTALLLLAIASFESGGFRADVDQVEHASGDHGHAWCLAQVHAPFALVVTDRTSCFRAELAAIRESRRMCPAGSFADGLSGYTVGHCEPGEVQAVHRYLRAVRYADEHPFPLGP